MKRLHIAISLLLTLTACPRVQADHPQPGRYTVEDSTQDTTAAGRDDDHNGIRDDIDALIAAKYRQSPAQTEAARQVARVMQIEATTANPSKDKAIAIVNELSDAVGCLMSRTSLAADVHPVTRLAGATYNTVERTQNSEKVEASTGPLSLVARGAKGCTPS